MSRAALVWCALLATGCETTRYVAQAAHGQFDLLGRARPIQDVVNDPNTPLRTAMMLADMVGTTRSRVNFFMNKFRKMGLIEYNGGIKVHNSLLGIVLRDS